MDIQMMSSEKLGYNAPYVQTKPVHRSQKQIEQQEDSSMIFEIHVVINQELKREFFGYADGICILSPQSLADFMAKKLNQAVKHYK